MNGGGLANNYTVVSVESPGTATFTQSGGTMTAVVLFWLPLRLQWDLHAERPRTLSGNDDEDIGDSGNGNFAQSGGNNNFSSCYLGSAVGGNGTYNLSGTGHHRTDAENVGYSGTGSFTQSNGSNTNPNNYSSTNTSGLYLGYYSARGERTRSAGAASCRPQTSTWATTRAPRLCSNRRRAPIPLIISPSAPAGGNNIRAARSPSTAA